MSFSLKAREGSLESELKAELVKQAKARGAYARRLEDRFAVGLLDLVFVSPNYGALFAEGKLIHGQQWGPTDRQYVEGERIKAAGGLVALIGWDDATDQMYVSHWTERARKSEAYTDAPNANPYHVLLQWWKLQR